MRYGADSVRQTLDKPDVVGRLRVPVRHRRVDSPSFGRRRRRRRRGVIRHRFVRRLVTDLRSSLFDVWHLSTSVGRRRTADECHLLLHDMDRASITQSIQSADVTRLGRRRCDVGNRRSAAGSGFSAVARSEHCGAGLGLYADELRHRMDCARCSDACFCLRSGWFHGFSFIFRLFDSSDY